VGGRRCVFAPGADPAEPRAWRFLLSWVGATLVFFSLSSGKRGLYLVPLQPAVALLLADSLQRWVRDARRIPVAFHATTGAVGAAAVAAGVWLALRDPLGDERAALVAGGGVVAVVGAALLAQLVLWRARARLRMRLAIPVLAVGAIELLVFAVADPARDAQKSPRAIAEAAAAATPADRPIGLVGDAALAGGLAYYGGRRIALLDAPDEIAQFVTAGGGALVVAEKKRDRVDAVTPTRVLLRAREGRRAVLVLAPGRAGPDGD
jgi:hypothetical protein